MLAYERAAWTDEELNPAQAKENFELPEVEGGVAKWRWCEGSKWTIEGEEDDDAVDDKGSGSTQSGRIIDKKQNENNKPSPSLAGPKKDVSSKTTPAASKGTSDDSRTQNADGGWIYYDTKWRFPRRGQDGWGKYTRRRKWARDAELIEVNPAATSVPDRPPTFAGSSKTPMTQRVQKKGSDDASSTSGASVSTNKRLSGPGWFARNRGPSKSPATTAVDDSESGSFSMAVADRDGEDDDDGYVPMPFRGRQGAVEAGWGVGEDVGMELG